MTAWESTLPAEVTNRGEISHRRARVARIRRIRNLRRFANHGTSLLIERQTVRQSRVMPPRNGNQVSWGYAHGTVLHSVRLDCQPGSGGISCATMQHVKT